MFKILFGFIYTIVYAFLAIAQINTEGTGTFIFIAPLLTWVFLFTVLYLSNKLDDLRSRIFFIALMATHYATSLVLINAFWNDSYNGNSRLMRTWEGEPNLVVFTLIWYLSGQFIIWIIFFRALQNRIKVEK